MKKLYITAAIIAFLIILMLLAWIFNLKKDVRIQALPPEIKTTKQSIDSVSVAKINEISDFTKRLENDAKTSKKIINSIKHEKINVRDTSYAAMCKYVETYRPN